MPPAAATGRFPSQVAWGADENKALPRNPPTPVHFVTCSIPATPVDRAARACAPVGPARATVWRELLAAVLAIALAFAGTAGQAWDSERMLAAAQRQGPGALAGVRALQPVLAGLLELDDEARMAAINQFFNRRIVFTDDELVWGVADHWASPIEMLEKGRGDCEDYAIAKYFSLLAVGVPVAKLRLVYVRAQVGGPGGVVQAHMVLAYYPQPGAEPLILDNLIGDVRPASRRTDLTPVFSFNSEGLWQGAGGPAAGDPTARLSRWREVLAKARAEGFQ
jgi:predicted transglutaminase-like cysteine proteinase